jgi:hypothetical protein
MISWPRSLIAEIAERRCIIVMGSGASAGCTSEDGNIRPPDWETLLKDALQLVRNDSDTEFAEQLINEKEYLDAAQIIVDNINSADFTQFLRDRFVNPNFSPSEIHKIIHDLDLKIVLTTNYDDIYDRYCLQGPANRGHNVCRYYEDHAINDIRSTTRLILKAHGCISHPAKVVMTRASYFEARREHTSFYAILDALFLTNTLLFVGCSLSDPDIQLVLENANISAPSNHPHYALVERGRHPSIVNAIRKTYNIVLLEYPKGKHDEAEEALRTLKDAVLAVRALPT